MKPGARRLGLVATGLALAAAGAGLVSAERVRDQIAVIEACEATSTGDYASALSRTRDRVNASETGRAAAECRCLALLASERGEECAELLARVLADPRSEGWAPRTDLSIHLIQTWREEGRAAEAAGLARRAAQAHPDDAQLFALELSTRASVEDEGAVLAELEARLARREAAPVAMRVALANRWLLRGEPSRALSVLGAHAPERARRISRSGSRRAVAPSRPWAISPPCSAPTRAGAARAATPASCSRAMRSR